MNFILHELKSLLLVIVRKSGNHEVLKNILILFQRIINDRQHQNICK
jgi:hypothetical protein